MVSCWWQPLKTRQICSFLKYLTTRSHLGPISAKKGRCLAWIHFCLIFVSLNTNIEYKNAKSSTHSPTIIKICHFHSKLPCTHMRPVPYIMSCILCILHDDDSHMHHAHTYLKLSADQQRQSTIITNYKTWPYVKWANVKQLYNQMSNTAICNTVTARKPPTCVY